jgi:hypothetical protein
MPVSENVKPVAAPTGVLLAGAGESRRVVQSA